MICTCGHEPEFHDSDMGCSGEVDGPGDCPCIQYEADDEIDD